MSDEFSPSCSLQALDDPSEFNHGNLHSLVFRSHDQSTRTTTDVPCGALHTFDPSPEARRLSTSHNTESSPESLSWSLDDLLSDNIAVDAAILDDNDLDAGVSNLQRLLSEDTGNQKPMQCRNQHPVGDPDNCNVEKHLGSGQTLGASKDVISERKRRRRLNDQLYSLRALVPKVTKMDKASIVTDALAYVEDLRKQIENLQVDIMSANLQSNYEFRKASKTDEISSTHNTGCGKQCSTSTRHYTNLKITELSVSKIEENTFLLRIVCKEERNAIQQLTRTLESLGLEIINASFMSFGSHIFNTVLSKAKKWEAMRVEEIKDEVMAAASKYDLQETMKDK